MRIAICIIAIFAMIATFDCTILETDEHLTDNISSTVLVDSDSLYTASVTYNADEITLQEATLVLDSVQVFHQDATVEVFNDWQSPLHGVLPAHNPHWEEDNHLVESSVTTSGIDVDTSTWDFVDPAVIMDILCPPGH